MPTDFPSSSEIGLQVESMRKFLDGQISGKEFEQEFLASRRKRINKEETASDDLEYCLSEVFYAVDEYETDPELIDTDSVSDEELRAIVRAQLTAIERL